MNVVCPSCRSVFEIDADLAAGPGAPLCEACSAAGEAPPPPPVRRSRPRLPEISFRRRTPKELPETEPDAEAPAERASNPEPAGEGPRSSDPEPLSLDDLEMISAPTSADGPLSSREPGASQVLDGGFVRSGRPLSILPPHGDAPDPGPMSRRGAELSLDDLASDVEPVSLRDLGVVLGPATVPPAWTAAPSPGLQAMASALKPRARGRETPKSAPPPAEPFAHGDAEGRAAPQAPAEPSPARPSVRARRPRLPSDGPLVLRRRPVRQAPPPSEEKPSFFRFDSVPPPPPAPVDDIPVDLVVEEPPPSSGRVDLEALLAPSEPPPSRAEPDLLRLSGGLFAGVVAPQALEPLPSGDDVPPSAPLAPVLSPERVPRSSRRPLPPGSLFTSGAAPGDARDGEVAPPPSVRRGSRPSAPGAASGAKRRERRPVEPSYAPGPVVSERHPAPRRSGVFGWAAAAVVAVVVVTFVAVRFGSTTAGDEAREVGVSTATPAPPKVLPPGLPAPQETRPVSPPPNAALPPAEPPRPTEPRPPKEQPTGPTAPPPAPSPPAAPSPVAQSPVAPPAAPPVVAPSSRAAPPPPAGGGGGEFDKNAARTALAAASSMAAGCKQPDDPVGGVRVTVTFAPSGRVTSSRLAAGPLAGTATGGCIIRAFRTITVPAFSGDPVSITKEVSVR